jgi:hypothetical protein
VVQACVVGLLRANKLRIEPDGGQIITATRDAGARDVFEKDRDFRRASFFPAEEGTIGARDINRICGFFDRYLDQKLDRDPGAIADALCQSFPAQAQRLRDVIERLNQLPQPAGDSARIPHALEQLETAIESCMRVVRQTEPTLQAVKRHLDKLSDGFEQLKLLDVELTSDVLQDVRTADDVLKYQLAQLEELGGPTEELKVAAEQIRSQLQGEKPWRDLAGIEPHLEAVRGAYLETRRRILADNGKLEEDVRGQIKAREGFATLAAEQSHHVLRPIAEALPDTTEESVFPSLAQLHDGARHALEAAAEEANERLDQLLSEGPEPPVHKIGLRLRNREIRTQAELDAMLDELRSRIEPELRAGRRVRLVE